MLSAYGKVIMCCRHGTVGVGNTTNETHQSSRTSGEEEWLRRRGGGQRRCTDGVCVLRFVCAVVLLCIVVTARFGPSCARCRWRPSAGACCPPSPPSGPGRTRPPAGAGQDEAGETSG